MHSNNDDNILLMSEFNTEVIQMFMIPVLLLFVHFLK